ncbi:MAG: hypothetical protein ABJL44_18635 [Algibacter sp.]
MELYLCIFKNKEEMDTFKVQIEGPDFEYSSNDIDLEEHWKEASKIFEKYQFEYQESKITLHSDFNDIFIKAKKHNEFWGGIIEIKITYDDSKHISNKENIENFIITSFIDVLFLCLNLSLPGSMAVRTPIIFHREFKDKINLSAGYLQNSFDVSNKLGGWPDIKVIPLKHVVKWYNSLNIGLKIKAENDIERTLFSLLYFCNDNHFGFNPTLIVWIIQSLESFFGIKSNDSIIRTLKSRIFMHLGKTLQPKIVNKKINAFYDYRSKFVHGDMEILRYGSDKFLTADTINEYYFELIKLCDFGATLIVSSLQKMIINDSNKIEFKETIVYK